MNTAVWVIVNDAYRSEYQSESVLRVSEAALHSYSSKQFFCTSIIQVELQNIRLIEMTDHGPASRSSAPVTAIEMTQVLI